MVDILTDSVSITWGTNKSATGSVEYGTNQQIPENVKGSGTPGLTHKVTLTGLKPDTTYFARISSVVAIPAQSISSSISFRTASAAVPVDRIAITTPPNVISLISTSATIFWNTNRNGNGVVEYGISESLGSAVTAADLSTTSHTVTITGLNESTRYFYRVSSTDPLAQSSATSTIFSFTTAPRTGVGIRPSIIDVPTASAITTTSAVIQWKTDQYGNSRVDYGTTDLLGQGAGAPESVVEHKVLISGLTLSTKYKFSVSTTTASAAIVTSGILEFTTSAAATSSINITGVPTATGVTSVEATVVWATDSLGNSRLEFGTTPGLGGVQAVADNTNLHKVVLSGLTAGTKYFFRASSTTQDGKATATSGVLEFTTPAAAALNKPKIATPPAVTFKTDTAATIEWKTDIPATARVSYGTTSGLGLSVGSPDTTQDHKIVLSGLNASTRYFYQVQTSNLGGTTDGSAQEFTTEGAPVLAAPLITSGPLIDGVTDRSFIVRWVTDQPGNSIVNYGLTQSVPETVSDPGTVTNHSVTVTGLTPNTDYSVKASTTATNTKTVSSAVISARTAPGEDTRPPVITEGPIVVRRDHSSATIFWRTDENSNSVVHFGTTGALGRTVSNPANVTEHTMTLSGLSSSTTYLYRAASTDSKGNGPTLTAFLTFPTDSVPDTAAPVILSGPELAYTSDITAIVVWTTDEASNSEVRYGSTQLNLSKVDSALVTNHSVQLTNLTANTAYLIQVVSTDAAGNTARSAAPGAAAAAFFITSGEPLRRQQPQTSFRTATVRDTTPPSVSGIRAAYVGEDSALIEWDTNEVSTAAILYGLAENALDVRTGNLDRVLKHQLRLTNLRSSTRYFYKVESTDPSGNTTTSAVQSLVTATAKDTAAPRITVGPSVSVTVNSTTISWTTDESSDSLVEFSLSTQLNLTKADTSPTTQHSVVLTNLLPGTVYNYRVSSTDIAGNGPTRSATLKFTTAGTGTGFTQKLYFPQFGFGNVLTSTLTLVNPSKGSIARGILKFREIDGRPFGLRLNGADIQGNVEFALAPNGLVTLVTGGAGDIKVGSVLVESNFPITGTVIFDLPGLGTAGVGESRPLRSFIAPVERSGGGAINTGVAMAHASGAAVAKVLLTLRDKNGNPVGQPEELTLPVDGQVAKFLDELFARQNLDLSDFTGTLTAESDADIAATVLRQSQGARNSLATLPVADVNETNKDLIFAQFGFGGGLFSQLTFVNPSKTASASGNLKLFRAADGSLFPTEINGSPTTGEIPVTVGPLGIQIFTTTGSEGSINVGWARLQTDNPLGGSILFTLADIGTGGVPVSKAQKEFIAPMERDKLRNINTGIAIANTETTPASIKITLKDEVGLSLASKTIQLVASGQTARFIDQLFPEVNTDSFRGILAVESNTLVAGTVIRTIPGEMATLPVGSVVP